MIYYDYLPSIVINEDLHKEYIRKCSPNEKYINWWTDLPNDVSEEAVDKELRKMDEVALYLLNEIDYPYEILDKQVIYKPLWKVSECLTQNPTIGFKIRILEVTNANERKADTKL